MGETLHRSGLILSWAKDLSSGSGCTGARSPVGQQTARRGKGSRVTLVLSFGGPPVRSGAPRDRSQLVERGGNATGLGGG